MPPLEAPVKPEWEEAAPGIHVKILARNAENDSVSMLVRLDPGTDYPGHSQAGIEELHLLHGVLKVDDRTLYPGDFIHSEAGSVDRRVWSETGCTCFLVTSTKDALLLFVVIFCSPAGTSPITESNRNSGLSLFLQDTPSCCPRGR